MRTVGYAIGGLVGALLSAPLIALQFLAHRLLGISFPPFDLFDWLARILPGAVVTFGIEVVVAVVVRLPSGNLSEAAKTAEQALAVAIFVGLCTTIGAAFFGLNRSRSVPSAYLIGISTGLALGLVIATVGPSAGEGFGGPASNRSDSNRPLTVLSFVLWGATLAWSYGRLAYGRSGRFLDAQPPGAAPATSRAPADRTVRTTTPAAASATAPTTAELRAERLDRRNFLIRLGGATAVITVAGAGIGSLLRTEGRGRLPELPSSERGWSAENPLPNARAAVEPVPGTRPEFTRPEDHYRIDINLASPTVRSEEWRLSVGGLVEAPRQFSLDQLRNYPPMHEFITLACISNPLGGDLISTTRWTGVSMQRLLPDLNLSETATHLKISSLDGFFEIVPLETILADERVMLAYEWDGLPLPTKNGYPLRIFIPDVYGMKQPKWINRIEALDEWEAGFWVVRGWDAVAQVRSTSVIDTVATDMAVTRGVTRFVSVGGIAYAGARGISKVEVQVDDGEWQEAMLRQPLSELSWVLWRFDWPFAAGRHTFTVRCYDGDGNEQIAEPNPTHPSGATGLMGESVNL